jgi:hypothetical protein
VNQNERLGDRRGEIRFEIVGDVWATLVTAQSLPFVNLGPGGILVESAGPLTVGSLQRVRMALGDHVENVAAIVRHVTPMRARPARYLVGLEFVDLPAETRGMVEAFVGEQRATVSGDAEASDVRSVRGTA